MSAPGLVAVLAHRTGMMQWRPSQSLRQTLACFPPGTELAGFPVAGTPAAALNAAYNTLHGMATGGWLLLVDDYLTDMAPVPTDLLVELVACPGDVVGLTPPRQRRPVATQHVAIPVAAVATGITLIRRQALTPFHPEPFPDHRDGEIAFCERARVLTDQVVPR